MATAKNVKSPDKQSGKVSVKTATYTIKESESGTLFKWNSATSFNFELPKVRAHNKGMYFDFVIKTAATSGTGHGISPKSDDLIEGATATGVDDKDVYFAMASDAIGNGFRAVSNGTTGYDLCFISGTLAQQA